jgi:hypothetical protein
MGPISFAEHVENDGKVRLHAMEWVPARSALHGGRVYTQNFLGVYHGCMVLDAFSRLEANEAKVDVHSLECFLLP